MGCMVNPISTVFEWSTECRTEGQTGGQARSAYGCVLSRAKNYLACDSNATVVAGWRAALCPLRTECTRVGTLASVSDTAAATSCGRRFQYVTCDMQYAGVR